LGSCKLGRLFNDYQIGTRKKNIRIQEGLGTIYAGESQNVIMLGKKGTPLDLEGVGLRGCS